MSKKLRESCSPKQRWRYGPPVLRGPFCRRLACIRFNSQTAMGRIRAVLGGLVELIRPSDTPFRAGLMGEIRRQGPLISDKASGLDVERRIGHGHAKPTRPIPIRPEVTGWYRIGQPLPLIIHDSREVATSSEPGESWVGPRGRSTGDELGSMLGCLLFLEALASRDPNHGPSPAGETGTEALA